MTTSELADLFSALHGAEPADLRLVQTETERLLRQHKQTEAPCGVVKEGAGDTPKPQAR
jgi:hypothetical protein